MINLNKVNKKIYWLSLVASILVACIIGWFGNDIQFWWTKGIPKEYYRANNIYIKDVHETVWGVDLENNLLTVKGKKTKGWYVKVYAKWSSSGGKCSTRRDWSEKPEMIPSRYNSEYYGIDLGEEYTIRIPQQVNHDINKCNDEIDEIYVYFYNSEISISVLAIKYYGRNIPVSKGRVGYPNQKRKSHCWKNHNSVFGDDTLVGFCKTKVNGPDPSYVYYDQIKPYTINLDFCFLDEEPLE
ncbi:hypothetical protein [Zooshikella ganghwensis]|uniref:hypothetical protein n=1 Tax=Zooshikella ganghwensis TaxID=202772 RepID=UPI000400234F|nr:hypothetical protein [Zooshikella ganghwensis]